MIKSESHTHPRHDDVEPRDAQFGSDPIEVIGFHQPQNTSN